MDQAKFVLICFPILTLVAFAVLRPREACIATFIGGWLFLPISTIELKGIPDFTKTTALQMSVFACTLAFDFGRLTKLRPRWYDLPIVIYSISSLFSSLSNQLGVYDGVASSLGIGITWGLPYLIGRAYLADLDGLRELAIAVVIGGFLYAPLCMLEILISPQLHRMVYGFHQHHFGQSVRFGGYRPTVFMRHGLEVGMWLTASCLCGTWLCVSGAWRRFSGAPTGPLVAGLFVIAVLCKSTGALVLLMGGLVIMGTIKVKLGPLAIAGLLLVSPLYIASRGSGTFSAQGAIDLAEMTLGGERARSLEVRIKNENMLSEKGAASHSSAGGDGSGRGSSTRPATDICITDGFWIIQFGNAGAVGVASVTAALLQPLFLLMRRFRVRSWLRPNFAGAAALAVLLGLWMIDNLLNAQINPIYLLASGALTGLDPAREIRRRVDRGRSLADRGMAHQAVATLDVALQICDAARGKWVGELRAEASDELAGLLSADPDGDPFDPARAADLAAAAVRLSPGHGPFLGTLGIALYRLGDDGAAIDALREAEALDGPGPRGDLFLGMAHRRKGEADLARQYLERADLALRQHPTDDPDLIRARHEAGVI